MNWAWYIFPGLLIFSDEKSVFTLQDAGPDGPWSKACLILNDLDDLWMSKSD